MNSATAFRFLILIIPTVWVVMGLLPAEYPQYRNLRAIASQAHHSHQGMIGRDKETYDKFVNSNRKEVHMDHIKLMIYGFIGIGVVVSVIALIVKMLGLARYG